MTKITPQVEKMEDAITNALLRAVKAGGYRAVVRQIGLHQNRLRECTDERGRESLKAVLVRLEALKATMPVPEGYLPGMEG